MIDMTNRSFNMSPVRPIALPDEVRLEAGMMLAQKVPEARNRPGYQKLIVLVNPITISKRVSIFDPDKLARHDVAGWMTVRMRVEKSHPHPGMGGGTRFSISEKQLRSGWKFVGHLGSIQRPIDWDSF